MNSGYASLGSSACMPGKYACDTPDSMHHDTHNIWCLIADLMRLDDSGTYVVDSSTCCVTKRRLQYFQHRDHDVNNLPQFRKHRSCSAHCSTAHTGIVCYSTDIHHHVTQKILYTPCCWRQLHAALAPSYVSPLLLMRPHSTSRWSTVLA